MFPCILCPRKFSFCQVIRQMQYLFAICKKGTLFCYFLFDLRRLLQQFAQTAALPRGGPRGKNLPFDL